MLQHWKRWPIWWSLRAHTHALTTWYSHSVWTRCLPHVYKYKIVHFLSTLLLVVCVRARAVVCFAFHAMFQMIDIAYWDQIVCLACRHYTVISHSRLCVYLLCVLISNMLVCEREYSNGFVLALHKCAWSCTFAKESFFPAFTSYTKDSPKWHASHE